ncbi:hypothetical protein [Laspinema palackyanum]|uniref:hypothetical protein n=1 Tax=Laspinema palackyanum TaxID=3231601 RepID=UPI00345C9386|nr:hypothetical protein [Laspinema sp. D2c]
MAIAFFSTPANINCIEGIPEDRPGLTRNREKPKEQERKQPRVLPKVPKALKALLVYSSRCYPRAFFQSGIAHTFQKAIASHLHPWDSFLKQKPEAVSCATFFRSQGTENITVRDIDANLAVFFLNPDLRLGSP